ITFDKLPQAVGYLTEQVERIHKIVAALQPQTTTDKHRIVEIDEACQITRKAKPTIYTLARKGLIPAYKRGKKLYFYEDELLQWIESVAKIVHNFFCKKITNSQTFPSMPLYT
ncbi:MAG: helix-turn-helix domain-containing protein, partial [Rikenellaceae bacterium]|nr:helix-turn-helix domain-containing protein [Rikenellaceae bacterium]